MTNEPQKLRLWLDDIRVPPDDSWTWAKTVEDAIALMKNGDVSEASLDNDLGKDVREGRALVYWMAENGCWPLGGVFVHSANVVAREYMNGMIKRYGPYE